MKNSSERKNKVLITGGTGFLGRHLTRDLIRKGFQVSILARKSSHVDLISDQTVEIIYGDITDPSSLLEATKNKDVVYHLAGVIAYKKSDRSVMDEVNIQGTANVIAACIRNQVNKVLHLSSVVTIGANFKPEPIDENFQYNLEKYNLGYFETKRKAEELMVEAFHKKGLKTYLINPSTIYGEGDFIKSSRRIQMKVAQGRFKFYPPGGVNVVDVEDVIKAIDLCLKKGRPARRYIISGDNMTIKELFYNIADIAGMPPPTVPLPRFLLKGLGYFGDFIRVFNRDSSLSSETAVTASLYHWFSNGRARRELGFEPSSAKKALEKSVLWMLDNQKAIKS